MKFYKHIAFLLCIIMNINSQRIDEYEGRYSFLACMGYHEEVIYIEDDALEYEKYTGYEDIGKDILLIINYNHAYYGNNEFIKKLYSPYFPNIVFYGPEHHPEVRGYNAQRGVLGYMPLAFAMEQYPNYKGYLYLEDDCVVHFWNLIRFDKDKMWITDKNGRRTYYFGEHSRWSHWNDKSWGWPAMEKAYKKLPEKYRAMLHANCGKNRAIGGLADIAYFPAKYREDIIFLCNLFNKENVFIELALPTIAACLDYESNWESIHGRWESVPGRPDRDGLYDGYDLENNYNTRLDFAHPVKLSNIENRKFTLKQFEKMALRLGIHKKKTVIIQDSSCDEVQ